MRRKVNGNAAGIIAHRITPAHAGKSSDYKAPHLLPGDHPRACGEKISLPLHFLLVLGSPPRMRGKDGASRLHLCFLGSPPRMRGKAAGSGCAVELPGITPAHAGKSGSCTRQKQVSWDHPRACGEKTKESFVNSQLSSGCSKNIIQF